MTPQQALQVGIERLVHNTAEQYGLSYDRAIFLLESQLQDLKRRGPTPTDPPVVSMEKAA